tara:strand:- start:8070 stop:8369 length:300 start_codon:yes stop_codon:yes gene_type:complete
MKYAKENMQKKSEKKEETVVTETEASKIWSEIKDKDILMFALPGQKVSHYCSPVVVEPTKLYLLVTATSVTPALETAIGNKYSVDLVNKYTVVSRSKQF